LRAKKVFIAVEASSITYASQIIVAITECGGHLAWSTGLLPTGKVRALLLYSALLLLAVMLSICVVLYYYSQSWIERPACEFFEATLKLGGKKLSEAALPDVLPDPKVIEASVETIV
jgi:hypothetical protein